MVLDKEGFTKQEKSYERIQGEGTMDVTAAEGEEFFGEHGILGHSAVLKIPGLSEAGQVSFFQALSEGKMQKAPKARPQDPLTGSPGTGGATKVQREHHGWLQVIMLNACVVEHYQPQHFGVYTLEAKMWGCCHEWIRSLSLSLCTYIYI